MRLLLKLISEIELDGQFDGEPATYELRPMRALNIAQVLCWDIEDIECVNLIVANEI